MKISLTLKGLFVLHNKAIPIEVYHTIVHLPL